MAKLKEIADWVEATVAGHGSHEVVRVSGISDADHDSLVFAKDEGALKAALASKAGAILTKPELANGLDDSRLLLSHEPRWAFALAAKKLAIRSRSGVDERAAVDDSAQIGHGTFVGPGAVIGEDVVIGEGCRIDAQVVIYPGTRIGSRVVVQAGAVLGSAGFGYARNPKTGEYVLFPQQGRLVIEDDVEIGANTTIDRGALEETRIGKGTKIDNLVHIGHNCHIGKNVIIAAQTGISGSSVVEDDAILGGQVGMGEHATVGKGVILGGGAGVLTGKKLRGPGQVFWGRPAQPLKQYLRDLARLRKG